MGMLDSFASRHGVRAQDIHSGTVLGAHQAARLQQELSHYQRGWEDFTMRPWDTWGNPDVSIGADKEDVLRLAEHCYERMRGFSASLGSVSRTEYVDGFVDAWWDAWWEGTHHA